MGHGHIDIIGKIWMPNTTAAQRITLTAYDVENIGRPITRYVVEDWLGSHAGDFQSVEDFYADIDGCVLGWKDEESECTYSDCMFPAEDDEDTADAIEEDR